MQIKGEIENKREKMTLRERRLVSNLDGFREKKKEIKVIKKQSFHAAQ